jgi:hypothetical protein
MQTIDCRASQELGRRMDEKWHSAKTIIAKLHQADMLLTNGCRRRPCAGRDRDDLLCWRSEYGGLKGDQVKRLKKTSSRRTLVLRKATNAR